MTQYCLVLLIGGDIQENETEKGIMKVAIYCRTSTTEQDPEKQLIACRKFCENRGYEIESEYLEQLSGFSQKTRPQYDIIKSKAFRGEIKAVVVWALDRWVRNRDTLLEDVTTLRNYGCKIHSVQEEWLEAVNIDGALGKTIQDFLLGLVGSIAEMESQRKSERTKMAFASKKGKKWGRRSLPQRVHDDVLRLHAEGKSMRWMSQNVYYYDKNKNKKKLGLGSVHKIISQKRPDSDT